MLTSLKRLDLSGCSVLERGESRGGLVSMFRRLLPHYQECVPLSKALIQGLSGLRHLRDLDLSWCNLLNVPSEIGNLMILQRLDLTGNKFSSIPSTLSNLRYLRKLFLPNCDQLKHLPLLPNNLDYLEADNCLSLESETVGTQCARAKDMRFLNCPKLDDKKIERDIIRSFQDDSQASFFLHYSELPLDLGFYGNNGSRTLSFVVPPNMGRKIRGLILRAVFSMTDEDLVWYRVINKGTKAHVPPFESEIKWLFFVNYQEEIMWVNYVGLSEIGFNLEGGDEMKVIFFSLWANITLNKWGIKFIYEGDENAPVLRASPTL